MQTITGSSVPGPPWLNTLAVLTGSALIGWLVWWPLFAVLGRIARGRLEAVGTAIVRNLRAPFALILPFCAVLAAVPALSLSAALAGPLYHGLEIVLIALGGWLALRIIRAAGHVLALRYRVDAPDNLHARKVDTQFKVMQRIAGILIGGLALGLILITFPGVRAFGATLFASAGAAGIVLGLAARPVLTNLLAGVQIGIAQPIRIGDFVVVEDESGWIEEINATYVVIRIWDLRRLVVPISYFVEKPFRNWTRTSTNLLGTALIYADYSVRVQAVRDELRRILADDALWDQVDWSLDVTNCTQHVVEMRATVSASSAGDLFNLCSHVREGLVAFLQKNYPESLPRTRVEMVSAPAPDTPSTATPPP